MLEAKKRLLVFGASGYLGRYIIKYFLEKGLSISIILRSKTKESIYIQNNVELIYLNDTNFDDKIKKLKIDYFINAAVEYGRQENAESDVVMCNLFLPLKILNLLETNSDFCFISFDSFFSKVQTFDKSVLPEYVLSKKNFIEWLEIYNFRKKNKIAILSIEHLVGPNESSTKFNGWFIQQCKMNPKEIRLTNGKQIRDFIFIDDVISAIDLVISNSQNLENRIYKFEVGSGKGYSLRSFCELVHAKLKSTAKLNFGIIPTKKNELLESIANNHDLIKLGWNPTTNLEIIVDNIIKYQK